MRLNLSIMYGSIKSSRINKYLISGDSWQKRGCFVGIPVWRLPNNTDNHYSLLFGKLRDIIYGKNFHGFALDDGKGNYKIFIYKSNRAPPPHSC